MNTEELINTAHQFADDLQQGEDLDKEEQMAGAETVWRLIDRIAELEKSYAELEDKYVLLSHTTPQTKPLSDEEIEEIAKNLLKYQIEGSSVSGVFDFARAIEKRILGK